MLSVTHALTGSFIASKLPNPLLYIPITLICHYFEDWIPHWDLGTGITSKKRKKYSALFMESFDLLLTGILIYYFWPAANSTLDMQFHIWFAALIGISPDLIEGPRNFFNIKTPWIEPINKFHDNIHQSIIQPIAGLLPQIVIVLLVYFLK
jgi:hypothetical protein